MVISENIVTSFNGKIGVKSASGKGTQFTFSVQLGRIDGDGENEYVKENNLKKIQISDKTEPIENKLTDSKSTFSQHMKRNINSFNSHEQDKIDRIQSHP